MSRVNDFVYRLAVSVHTPIFNLSISLHERINNWIYKKYDGHDVYNSNIMVVVVPTSDHNKAFSGVTPVITYKLHNQNYNKIVYAKCSSVEDLNSFLIQMKKQNNRIKGLWIKAHGLPYGFQLGEKEAGKQTCVVNYKDADTNKRINNSKEFSKVLKKLQPNSPIVLDSCLTGKVDCLGNTSIAQTLADLAPKCMVFAATEVTTNSSLNVKWKNNILDVTFMQPKRILQLTWIHKIKNLFYTISFYLTFGSSCGESITARMRSCKIKRSPTKRRPTFFPTHPRAA